MAKSALEFEKVDWNKIKEIVFMYFLETFVLLYLYIYLFFSNWNKDLES